MNSLQNKYTQLKELMPLIRESLDEGKSVFFMPNGISMLPMLHQGIDKVTLSPLPEQLKKYDLPLYQRENGQYVIHRIVRVSDTYTCCGDNQFVLEEGLRHDQMIALVTEFTHKGKTISVTHPLYRLYCRFWCLSRPVRHIEKAVTGRIKNLLKRLIP